MNGINMSDLTERARGAVYAGPPRRTIGNDDAIFDHSDPKIKEVNAFGCKPCQKHQKMLRQANACRKSYEYSC